jgi:hypothetical protein
MPLGNGDISLNAWVEPSGDLLFYIGKSDSWEDNSRLAKVGLVRVRLTPGLLPAGAAFSQTLDPAKGEMSVTATPSGAPPTVIRVWVDANHPVAQVTIDGPPETSAAVSFEPWRTAPTTIASESSDINFGNPAGTTQIVEPDITLTGLTDAIGWYHRNSRSLGPNESMRFQDLAGAPSFTDPILHRTFGALIKSAGAVRTDDSTLTRPAAASHRFDIHVLTRHPATAAAWLADIQSRAAVIEALDFNTRRNSHLAWWQAFWDRSHIEITPASGAADTAAPADLTRGYSLQRFITACAGRGAYPIKFNGSLFTMPWPGKPGDADYRRWGPGYWWQNTRLPYAPLCTSGDYDMLPSLYRMYLDDVMPVARHRAAHYYGPTFGDTCFLSEVTYPWGAVFTTSYGWTTPAANRPPGDGKLQTGEWHKREWVAGLELLAMMLDDFDHRQDSAFLTGKILPAALPILRWFDRYYATDATGKLVMNPSQALETWWSCTNPMSEVAGLHAITARLLAIPNTLIPAADRTFLATLQAKIPPLPTRTLNGNTLLAPAQVYSTKKNSEIPELYAVYPFRLVSFEKPNVSQGLAAYTAATSGDKGSNGWRQDDIFHAYLGDTTQARSRLVTRARSKDAGCRFPAFWGPNFDWTPDQCHGGVLMKATQSLILQTEGDRIFLLPAWPADWNVNFKLRAPKQTTVEGLVENGVLKSLTVTPAARRVDLTIGSGFTDPESAPPTSFRQGVNGYSHTATILRADNAVWNSGSRDQLLVGKTSGGSALRSVLSFPLTGLPQNAVVETVTLDLTTATEAGVGSVGELQLRSLAGTPVEGTGNGISATDGLDTGATWTSRTGLTPAHIPWSTPGGDFSINLLSSIPGYAATQTGVIRTFSSSTPLVAAAQSALASGQPLNLMLISPATEAGSANNITRFASDDHASLASRPLLSVTYTLPADPATFAVWREATWPGVTDPEITGTDKDPDGDSMTNLLEWALHSDATRPDSHTLSLARTNTTISCTYTRRKIPASEATYQIEWSDTLGDDWSTAGVVEQLPTSLSETAESALVTIPSGTTGKRFVRLKVRRI